jgi:hypothetical protein
MENDGFGASLRQIWENQPGIILLLAVGFVVFVVLVVDAWRHKRRKPRVKPHKWEG